jgi:hypothetical protein
MTETWEAPADLHGDAASGDDALYLYQCSGEVRLLEGVSVIEFRRDLLCICGQGCRPAEELPRRNVYLCSRIAGLPAPPLG